MVPPHVATYNSHIQVVEMLIKRGAHVNAVGRVSIYLHTSVRCHGYYIYIHNMCILCIVCLSTLDVSS